MPNRTRAPRPARNRARNRDRDNVGGVPSSITTLSRGAGFPRKLRMIHSYAESQPITINSGTAFYQFSCNGLYDPNTTGTGHSVMYYDELTAIYDHYTVFRSKMRVEFFLKTASPDTMMYAGYVDDDTSIAGTVVQAAEQVGAKHGYATSLAVKPYVIELIWDAKKYFGGDIFDNDDLAGGTTSNPAEQSYFTLFFQSTNAALSGTVQALVSIEYETVWDELKTSAQS